MKIGLKFASLWLGLLVLSLIGSLDVKAKNHTDFIPIALPSAHIMDNSVAFGHDQQGQTWLVTERGLSVFRDIQFVSFRSFDFESPIISAKFVENHVYIATENQVFRVRLNSPHGNMLQIWPLIDSPKTPTVSQDVIVAVHHANGNLENKTNIYVQTTTGLHQINYVGVEGKETAISNPVRVFNPAQQPRQITTAESNVFLLFNDTIELYSSIDNGWQTFGLANDVLSIAALNTQLFLLDKQGKLLSLDTETGKLASQDNVGTVEQIVLGSEDVYLRQGEYLRSMTEPHIKVREANFSNNIYIDSHRNIWLSTPFDIQVSWWQPLSITADKRPKWGDFVATSNLSRTGNYAIKNGILYALQEFDQKQWLPVWQDAQNIINGSRWILETQNHVWLVASKKVVAINKDTLTISHQMPLSERQHVFEFDSNQVIVFKENEIFTLSGEGRQQNLMDADACGGNCYLPWIVSNSIMVNNTLYFATSQGLFGIDKNELKINTKRLDNLNQLTPILNVYIARGDRLWLVYPNKVALFNPKTEQSQIYYSGFNRIFDARTDARRDLVFNSQRGWFKLSRSNQESSSKQTNFVVQQVVDELDQQYLLDVGNKVTLANDSDEIQLAFNIAKQHPSQQMQVRFKYSDEIDWSVVSMYNHSLRLKNLRQGANQLELQARLEGMPWQHAKTFNYILPYRFFQTKWVIVFVAACSLILLMVIVYERIGRVKVAFNSVTQEAFILSLLDSTKDGVWIANKDREIQSVNQAFIDITGYILTDVEGKSFQLHADFGRNHEVESLIWQEVIKTGFWVGEVWSKKSTGEKVSLDLSVTRVETENRLMSKTDVKFVGVFSDITHRKNSERELRLLATRDPLTNLANRTLFIEHVQHTIDMTTPLAPNFALMFLDLDNFKKVNESLGPLKGDEFICLVSERISKCLAKGVTLARLGGDEFAILIPNQLFSGVPAFFIKRVAKDIQRELMPAFWLGDTEISISASMGASVYPNHGDKPETLMRCADTALNRVKITGRNNCLIYDDVMDDLVDDKLSLESELIAGLNRQEFLVYYQPKYKIQENEICGFEALIRWQNPNRGLVSPDQFISIAEDNGLIRQLDFYVVKSVCVQIQAWLKAGVMRGKVAVNISALNFQQADFCESLLKIIASEGNLWNYIELEITETAMMRDPERALISVDKLRSKGLSIALDDFGTGHSSLGYLKTFPIDRIKIDRTFVKDIEFDEQDRNITSVIVQLAKHLGIAVIAEGVESESQAYLMHIMGCNEIQGYLISRPLPAEQVPELLKTKQQSIQSNSD